MQCVSCRKTDGFFPCIDQWMSYFPSPLQDLRIDVASIKVHPWVVKPLPEKYNVALAELQSCQKVVDEKVKQGAFSSPERDKILEV